MAENADDCPFPNWGFIEKNSGNLEVPDEVFYSPDRVGWGIRRNFRFLRKTLEERRSCTWVEDQNALRDPRHDIALQLARNDVSLLDEVERLLGDIVDTKLRLELGDAIVSLADSLLRGDGYSPPTDLHNRTLRTTIAREKGRMRGAKRQEKAAEWMSPALEFAKQARRKNPTLTQASLAEKIEQMWDKGKMHRSVGRDRLMKVIAAWEKSGELQKKSWG